MSTQGGLREALEATLIENPDDVLELLRLARASFDADGRWQRRGMAAVLLVQLASTQLLSTDDTRNPMTVPSAGATLSQEAAEAEVVEACRDLVEVGAA